MAWQLMACGALSPDGATDRARERQPARPSMLVDAPSPGDPTPSSTRAARSAQPEASRQHRGAGVAAGADDSDPIATPAAGWEAPQCSGSATRRITVAGNLDATSHEIPAWLGGFTPEDPASSANFSITVAAFDDQGRQQGVGIYFERVAQGWDYHVIMEGTAFLIGEGHLGFDEQGTLLSAEVTQELRLLTSAGPGHAVELDLSGMTSTSEPCNCSGLTVDGGQARWGTTCAMAEPMPDEQRVTGPACAAAATKRLALRANLAAGSQVASTPWNPLAPDAVLTSVLRANDEQGTLIDFALHLRRSSEQAWDYYVLLAGESPGQEVASGVLHFNPNGSLHSVATTRPLQFPNRVGLSGDPIELDFGPTTVDGGSGVDGVTALAGASFEVWQHPDGAVLDCVPRATTPPLATLRSPHCAGERTTALWLSFNLDPATPLGDSYQAVTTVYDAALVPREMVLVFRHVDDDHWQCDLSVAGAAAGTVDLYFTDNGAPARIENIPTPRLPLADGSDGPPIQLGFDQGWAITSFSSPSSGWLAPNGAVPNTDGCVDALQ